jgi:hypothetical protein
MANDPSSKPSFSAGLKWRAAFQVVSGIICVAAVVVMVNYLAGHYFVRFQLSARTRAELSPRTLSLIKSLTNEVNIILFYNRDDALYTTVSALLKEYHLNNPKISVRTVDYTRDAAEAEKVKMQYTLPSSLLVTHEKNWVIFDCEGRKIVFPGNGLAAYSYEQKRNTNEIEYVHKLVGFKGEVTFTSALLAVSNPKPLKAYFLQGHDEANPADEKDDAGFGKFTILLQQNYILPQLLSLAGTNSVPQDCNLLIIAGPTIAITNEELAKISQYLTDGGRLFVLFNYYSLNRPIGLEKVLATWGVSVGNYIIKDPKNTSGGADVSVKHFSKHPAVNSLIKDSQLQLIYPRAIGAIDANPQVADAPKVEEIAFSGPQSVEMNNPVAKPHSFPLMVAVEKGNVKGVVTERGMTRLLVVGDSLFLDNQIIESPAHRDFASYAVNWLLDRTILLQGLGPRPVTEYRVIMTTSQMTTVQWILLGAMPGAVLLFGGLVWLRRRK